MLYISKGHTCRILLSHEFAINMGVAEFLLKKYLIIHIRGGVVQIDFAWKYWRFTFFRITKSSLDGT